MCIGGIIMALREDILMENGKIVEQGNHKTLLAAEGAYYRLYMSRFAGSDVEETVVDDSTAVPS